MNDARPLVKNAHLTATLSRIWMQMTPIIRRTKWEGGEERKFKWDEWLWRRRLYLTRCWIETRRLHLVVDVSHFTNYTFLTTPIIASGYYSIREKHIYIYGRFQFHNQSIKIAIAISNFQHNYLSIVMLHDKARYFVLLQLGNNDKNRWFIDKPWYVTGNWKINVTFRRASSTDASIEIFVKTWRLTGLPSVWTSYGCPAIQGVCKVRNKRFSLLHKSYYLLSILKRV